MATTTVEPEGDPTFLAFERARQYGEGTLQRNAALDQNKADQDIQRTGAQSQLDQTNQLDKNMADYRASGFGQSGLRAQAEDRIRQQIALQMGGALSGYQHDTTARSAGLEDALALSQMKAQEEALAARDRLVQAQANAGMGI